MRDANLAVVCNALSREDKLNGLEPITSEMAIDRQFSSTFSAARGLLPLGMERKRYSPLTD